MLKLTVQFQNIVHRLRHREEGQTFVEYALLLGGVSVLLLAAFGPLDDAVSSLVTEIKNKIDAV
jgi:Flp pilus assembly pilin Flp